MASALRHRKQLTLSLCVNVVPVRVSTYWLPWNMLRRTWLQWAKTHKMNRNRKSWNGRERKLFDSNNKDERSINNRRDIYKPDDIMIYLVKHSYEPDLAKDIYFSDTRRFGVCRRLSYFFFGLVMYSHPQKSFVNTPSNRSGFVSILFFFLARQGFLPNNLKSFLFSFRQLVARQNKIDS